MIQNESLFHLEELIPISWMDLTQMTLFMCGIPHNLNQNLVGPFWVSTRLVSPRTLKEARPKKISPVKIDFSNNKNSDSWILVETLGTLV